MKITHGRDIKGGTLVKFAFKGGGQNHLKPYMLDPGATTWFYGGPNQDPQLLVGLGDREEFSWEALRQAAGNAGRALVKDKVKDLQVDLGGLGDLTKEGQKVVAAWVEGFLLGIYDFDKYKAEKNPQTLKNMELLSVDEESFKEGCHRGRVRAEAVTLARDLVNEPANYLWPEEFANRIQAHFSTSPLEIRVYKGDDLREEKFEGLRTVGQASDHPPLMVEMRYCTDPDLPLRALVGKGLTFDMGGMNVKTGRDISDMRCDMAGAAAVVGAMDIISKMSLRANVLALLPLAENLPDGKAFLPSHIVEYPNGLSVQVGNTDAEGRLVLADALLKARDLGAKEVVDIATLTGNIVSALGKDIAGIFGDEDLVSSLVGLSKENGDALWPMPLIDAYEKTLKSNYADLSNISSSPHAGAITAALFLRRFIDGISWAHIDMAGTMDVKTAKGYYSSGATGFGVRLLADYIESRP